MAACCSPPAAFSRRHLGWYRQNSLDHLLSTRSYPVSAAMPKDAAYYELLVKSRRVQRDTSTLNCICRSPKIKSKKRGRRFVVFPAKTLNVECQKSNVEGVLRTKSDRLTTVTKASFLTGRRSFRY